MRYLSKRAIALGAGLLLMSVPAVVGASNTPTLNQTINNGALTTNIYQSDDATPVASPAVNFSALNEAFTCQTSTGTLGDANDKVNVTNLDSSGGHSGWTLSMAATGGASATWTAGAHTYKYNDATGSGCTNGQLTIDPSVATLTADCSSSCVNTDVTKGTSTAMTSSTPVTLMSDSDYNPWEGYLTGISLSQKVPAQQYASSYSLGMTITVASN